MTTAAVRKTLVLNADGRPQATWPLNLVDPVQAAVLLWQDKAAMIEAWPDEMIRSPSWSTEMPKTVILRNYVQVGKEPKFCRKSVILRDHFRCQYCGETFSSEDLSFDHVHPKSRGGVTVWENVVMACFPCNAVKRDKTCEECGMWPLTWPKRPTTHQLLEAGLQHIPNDVREAWKDFLYWGAELRA